MEPTTSTPAGTTHRIRARTVIPTNDLIYTLPDALAALAQQVLDYMYTAQEEGFTLHPETFNIRISGCDSMAPNPEVKELHVSATVTVTKPNKNRKQNP